MAEWLRDVSVGAWYQADRDPFEIVGVDSHNEVVLVQSFDGTLEEIDFDSWLEMRARPVAAPEDWSGAMDMDLPDLDFRHETAGSPGGWNSPLDLLDQHY